MGRGKRRESHGILGCRLLTHCLLRGEGPSRPDTGLGVGAAPRGGLVGPGSLGLGAPGALGPGSLRFWAPRGQGSGAPASWVQLSGILCSGSPGFRVSGLWLSRFWGVWALPLLVLGLRLPGLLRVLGSLSLPCRDTKPGAVPVLSSGCSHAPQKHEEPQDPPHPTGSPPSSLPAPKGWRSFGKRQLGQEKGER